MLAGGHGSNHNHGRQDQSCRAEGASRLVWGVIEGSSQDYALCTPSAVWYVDGPATPDDDLYAVSARSVVMGSSSKRDDAVFWEVVISGWPEFAVLGLLATAKPTAVTSSLDRLFWGWSSEGEEIVGGQIQRRGPHTIPRWSQVLRSRQYHGGQSIIFRLDGAAGLLSMRVPRTKTVLSMQVPVSLTSQYRVMIQLRVKPGTQHVQLRANLKPAVAPPPELQAVASSNPAVVYQGVAGSQPSSLRSCQRGCVLGWGHLQWPLECGARVLDTYCPDRHQRVNGNERRSSPTLETGRDWTSSIGRRGRVALGSHLLDPYGSGDPVFWTVTFHKRPRRVAVGVIGISDKSTQSAFAAGVHDRRFFGWTNNMGYTYTGGLFRAAPPPLGRYSKHKIKRWDSDWHDSPVREGSMLVFRLEPGMLSMRVGHNQMGAMSLPRTIPHTLWRPMLVLYNPARVTIESVIVIKQGNQTFDPLGQTFAVPEDCAGIIRGDARLDRCGRCDADIGNDCVQDCTGVWGGHKYYDCCDVCNGDGRTCPAHVCRRKLKLLWGTVQQPLRGQGTPTVVVPQNIDRTARPYRWYYALSSNILTATSGPHANRMYWQLLIRGRPTSAVAGVFLCSDGQTPKRMHPVGQLHSSDRFYGWASTGARFHGGQRTQPTRGKWRRQQVPDAELLVFKLETGKLSMRIVRTGHVDAMALPTHGGSQWLAASEHFYHAAIMLEALPKGSNLEF